MLRGLRPPACGGLLTRAPVSYTHLDVYKRQDCGSALAEAEIEYQDKTSPAVDVAYSARNGQQVSRAFGSELPEGVDVAIPIWTTTPWTLPASLAISLGPELDYVLAEGPTKACLLYTSRCV